jgi:2-polyprenyl-3-methyl-5-hydroxy-6-metoxy-1,4-benzoquinol methylase
MMHTGNQVAKRNGFSVLDCRQCNFVHAILDSNHIEADLYSSHFYEDEKPTYIESNTQDRIWWDFTYGLRINRADTLAAVPLDSWVDIGTGPGNFLDAAVARGKKVAGIEPSTVASNHAAAKGHNVINAYYDRDIAKSLGKFGGVHCSEVLEHIPDPEKFLETIKLNMSSESILCVVVPNDFSLIQKIYTSMHPDIEKWWVDPPFHLNYFTNKSLRDLLKRSGFEVIHETCMFPIDIFLLMGDHYVGQEELGKASHERRKKMELAFQESGNLEYLEALYEEMAKLGIGRELVFYSRVVK